MAGLITIKTWLFEVIGIMTEISTAKILMDKGGLPNKVAHNCYFASAILAISTQYITNFLETQFRSVSPPGTCIATLR